MDILVYAIVASVLGYFVTSEILPVVFERIMKSDKNRKAITNEYQKTLSDMMENASSESVSDIITAFGEIKEGHLEKYSKTAKSIHDLALTFNALRSVASFSMYAVAVAATFMTLLT